MAITPMGRNNALTVEHWSARTNFVEMIMRTKFGYMAGRGTITRAQELDRAEKGDKITLSQVGRLSGQGTTEGGTLVGNEEALDLKGFSMVFNVVRHAVPYYGKQTIEDQRSYVNFQKQAEERLRDWHALRMDCSAFNQLAGVNSTTITIPSDGTVYSGAARAIVQGLNDVTAPSTNRIVRAGGQSNDQSLTSSDTFTLDLIDVALEKLRTNYPTAEALTGEEFDLYISHEQALDLKRDTSGKITWYINNLSAMEGGMMENPITQGDKYGTISCGKYANVNIYECNQTAYGVSSADSSAIPTVRRAVLCGKDALYFSSKFSGALTGEPTRGDKVPLEYFREERDYQYVEGTEARVIYGMKKNRFGNDDVGVVTISTYATSHTT